MKNTYIDYQKIEHEAKVGKAIKTACIYTFLGLWAVVVLFPFYYMILTSIKSLGSYNNEITPKLFTMHPTIENYRIAVTTAPLPRYMLNTLIFAVVTTLLMLIITIFASFAFARLKFRGKELVFTIFLSLMMIPTELVVITNYTTIVNLEWRNTFRGMILPSVTSIFYIYLLKENFMQVGDTLYYAAKVDGTKDMAYLFRVLVPINKPTIVSITILKIIECWNSFVWPRLVATTDTYYLVSNGIQEIKANGFGRDNIPAMMAAVTLISVPLIIVFIVFRKQIMAGVSKSGTKG